MKRHLAGVQHLMRHLEDENEDVMNAYYRTIRLEILLYSFVLHAVPVFL